MDLAERAKACRRELVAHGAREANRDDCVNNPLKPFQISYNMLFFGEKTYSPDVFLELIESARVSTSALNLRAIEGQPVLDRGVIAAMKLNMIKELKIFEHHFPRTELPQLYKDPSLLTYKRDIIQARPYDMLK